MIELAEVIAEHALDDTAVNWFRMPWRDGWNAVRLALDATVDHDDGGWLKKVCETRATGDDIYWDAQDRLSSMVTPSKMARAALRCLQILLAKSDGGGEVYNAILLNQFSSVFPESVAHLVLEHRCRDSIGVGSVLAGDDNDRLRRAFTTAWKRGLYLAAYSLPPAKLKPLKVVK